MTPSIDEPSLLRTVIDKPDDDTPRLIYADWLDEHGDTDRAEFIRIQCALAKVSKFVPRTPQLSQLFQREVQLLRKYEHSWLQPILGCVKKGLLHRGFVHYVHMTIFQFVSDGPVVFQNHPIRDLRLEGHSANLDQVVDSQLLGRLHRLDLSDFWDHSELAIVGPLLGSPVLPSVDVIQVNGLGISNEARARLDARFGNRIHYQWASQTAAQ